MFNIPPIFLKNIEYIIQAFNAVHCIYLIKDCAEKIGSWCLFKRCYFLDTLSNELDEEEDDVELEVVRGIYEAPAAPPAMDALYQRDPDGSLPSKLHAKVWNLLV